MQKTTTDVLAARIDILSVVLQEVARALAPAQAGRVAEAVSERVAVLAGAPLSPAAEEAITGELVPLLDALRSSAA